MATKWPWKLLTNEGEAKILLDIALQKAPSLRAVGLTGEGEYPDLRKVAACYDFLLGVRMRYSVDDRWTAFDRIARLKDWLDSREVDGDGWHGAFIAAALGRGAGYLQCGISCYLNLRSRDFAERLQSVSRHLGR